MIVTRVAWHGALAVAIVVVAPGCRSGDVAAPLTPDAASPAPVPRRARPLLVLPAAMPPLNTCDHRPVASVSIDSVFELRMDHRRVSRVVAGMRAAARACYRSGMKAHPYQAGAVRIKASIAPSGEPLPAAFATGDLDSSVVECVRRRFSQCVFPVPYGTPASVTATFQFAVQ